MAAKFPDAHEEISEQYLNCSICMEQFKDAKLLPCSHSFCEVCLVKYVGDRCTFRCPVCQDECMLPPGGVGKLKPSVAINGIIEIIKAKEIPGKQIAVDGTVESEKCESCLEGNQVNRCIECAFNICKMCSKVHGNIPLTKAHKLIDLVEDATVTCTKHLGTPLDHYCITCETLVCVKCIEDNHSASSHICASVIEQFDRFEIEQTDIQEKKSKAMEMLQHSVDYCDEQKRAVTNHATMIISELCNKVKKEELHLSCQLDAMQNSTEVKIRQDIDSVKSRSKLVKTSICTLEVLVGTRARSDTVVVGKKTSSNASIVVDSPQFLPGQIHGFLGEIKCSSVASNITSDQSLNASDFSLLFPGKIRNLGNVHFVIKVQEYKKGKIAVIKNMKAQVERMNKSGSQVTEIDVNEPFDVPENCRTLSAEYECTATGLHQLSVTVAGTHIQGSPFSFDIHPSWKCSAGIAISHVSNLRSDQYGNIMLVRTSKNNVMILDNKGNHKDNIRLMGFENPFYPTDIAVSRDGTYFISDQVNRQVVVCGNGIRCFGKDKLRKPLLIALNEERGYVYVADSGVIHMFNCNNGNHIKEFKPSIEIKSLVIDSHGVLIISDGCTLRRYSSDISFISNLKLGKYVHCRIAIDRFNNIYASFSNRGNLTVKKFNPRGGHLCTIYEITNVNGLLNYLAVSNDDSCNVFTKYITATETLLVFS